MMGQNVFSLVRSFCNAANWSWLKKMIAYLGGITLKGWWKHRVAFRYFKAKMKIKN